MTQLLSIATAANAAWNDAFNSRDIEKLAGFYAENATLSPGNGQALTGREAIAGLFRSFIEAGVHGHSLETIEVGGDGNTIFQVARWSAKGAPVDGVAPEFGGITMNVLEKDANGNWLTRAHVWNAGS
ncbi:MAG TPA: SgcJ/EcaC family oxidoreductase [Methylophilaceae bacterium]|nr:SgcJ/EcaC family oxidoreductase [Methylophilaceae bacterium]